MRPSPIGPTQRQSKNLCDFVIRPCERLFSFTTTVPSGTFIPLERLLHFHIKVAAQRAAGLGIIASVLIRERRFGIRMLLIPNVNFVFAR